MKSGTIKVGEIIAYYTQDHRGIKVHYAEIGGRPHQVTEEELAEISKAVEERR